MKPILKLLLLTGAFLIIYNGYAQISDSLYNALPPGMKAANRKLLSDGEKIIIMDSAYLLPTKYFNEIYSFAQDILLKGEASADNNIKIGNTLSFAHFCVNTDKEKAILYFKKVINYIGTSTGHSAFLEDAYGNLSRLYCGTNLYDSSINYCYKRIEAGRIRKDAISVFQGYKLLCDIYLIIGRYEKANSLNNIILPLANDKNWQDEYIERCLFKMRCYKNLSNMRKTKAYADSVISTAKYLLNYTRKDSLHWYGAIYMVLGQFNYDNHKYRQALAYYDSSLLKKYTIDPGYFTDNFVKPFYRDICLVWMGKYEGVKKLLDSLPVTSYNNRSLVCEALYKQAAQVKNWRKAFHYYQEYVRNQDSMKVTEASTLLAEAEQKYTIAEKQTQITTLENKSLLKEKEQAKLVIAGISAGLILLLAIVILIGMYRNAQVKRYSEKQLLTAELYKMEATIHEERQQQMENIAAQRKKIAENMHDEVSSGLAAFRFYIIDLKAKNKNAETTKVLTELEAEAHVLYQQARDFMKNLNANKPSGSYNVYALAEQLSARFNNEKVLTIKNNIDRHGVDQYFTGAMHYELYLVIKEAVANSIKHAGASLVDIAIYFKNHTCFFTINDNGKGFNMATAKEGLGLKSISNRIQTINGNMQINSGKDGTVVEGFFPV